MTTMSAIAAGIVIAADLFLRAQSTSQSNSSSTPIPLVPATTTWGLVGYAATVAVGLAFAGLIGMLVARLGYRRRSSRIGRLLIATAPVIPWVPLVVRTARLLFGGGSMRRFELGGVGPAAAAVVILAVIGGFALLMRRAVRRHKPREVMLVVIPAGLAAALWFVDGNYYVAQYAYLHEFLIATVHACVLVAGLMLTTPMRRTAPPMLRPAGIGASFVIVGLAAGHLLTFIDETPAARRLILTELQTSTRVSRHLPYRRVNKPSVAVGDIVLSERARRRARLRDKARAEFAKIAGDGDVRPNVIVVSVDAMRADRSSFLGFDKPTTPFLEEMARKSHVFTNAHSPSTGSFHSILAMLSGTYPATIDELAGVDPALISHHVQAAGWETAGFYHPVIFAVRSRDWPEPDVTLGFMRHLRPAAESKHLLGPMIDGISRSNGQTPFFYYAHWLDPHNPYHRREGHDFGDTGEQRYLSEIAFVDAQLRRLWQAVEKKGIANRTILVVTADHGESFGEHGEQQHGARPWETQCHVPLLIYAPRLAGHAARHDAPVGLTSLAPTLTDLLRLPALADEEAPSLLPTMFGLGDSADSYAIIERAPVSHLPGMVYFRGVVHDGWKLIHDLKVDVSDVFDLRDDYAENNNLAASAPEALARLHDIADEWDRDRRARRRDADDTSDDPEWETAKHALELNDFRRLPAFIDELSSDDSDRRFEAAIRLFDRDLAIGPTLPIRFGAAAKDNDDPRIRRLLAAWEFVSSKTNDPAPILEGLSAAEAEIRERCATVLSRRSKRVDDLGGIRRLHAEERHSDTKFHLACILAKHRDARVFDELVVALENPRGSRQKAAMAALLHLPDEHVGSRLVEWLRHPDTSVRQYAGQGLSSYDSPYRRRLIDALLSRHRQNDRHNGTHALRRYPAPKWRAERLRKLLVRDRGSRWRRQALRMLMMTNNDDRSLEALMLSISAYPETARGFCKSAFQRFRKTLVTPRGGFYRQRSDIAPGQRVPLTLDETARKGWRIGVVLAPPDDGPKQGDLVVIDNEGNEVVRTAFEPIRPIMCFDIPEGFVNASRPFSAFIDAAPSPSGAKWLIGGVLVTRIRTPLELWPDGMPTAREPCISERLDGSWATGLEPPDVLILQDREGAYLFHGRDESPQTLELKLVTPVAQGQILDIALNGTTIHSTRLPFGESTVTVEVPASAYRRLDRNELTFKATKRKVTRRKDETGLPRGTSFAIDRLSWK